MSDDPIFNPSFDETPFEVDYDAPEPGQFPPSIEPGKYKFIFKLSEKEPFKTGPIPQNGGQNHLKITVAPEVVLPDGTTKRIAFQTVTTYKSDKMANSSAADLIRSLDLTVSTPTMSGLKDILLTKSGQRTFQAVVGWETYFKSTQTRVSTSPRKKNGDLPWPKESNGKYAQYAINPSTGEKAFGREKILFYLLPSESGA